jgi:hypothetical protein
MTTQLYLILESNDLTKSVYAMVTTNEVVESILTGQIIILKENSPFYAIELKEVFLLDNNIKAIIESKLTRELGVDVILNLQKDISLPIFLEHKFGLKTYDIMNFTIDKEFKKVLGEYRNLRS